MSSSSRARRGGQLACLRDSSVREIRRIAASDNASLGLLLSVKGFSYLLTVMKRLAPLAVLLGLLPLFCSCSLGTDSRLAGQAVDQFHQQLAAGNDSAIYAAADPVYRKATSQQGNHDFFNRIRQSLGTCQGTRYTYDYVNMSTRGTFVNVHDTRKCTHGELDEQFVWHIVGGRPVLYSYRASSPFLAK